MTILAVPPLLPTIHRDLHLSEKLVGALTALPVLLLSAAAVLGSLLVARLGARRALILGLCLVAAAGAARGAGGTTSILFLMTFAMGAGIAVSQPALPSLVRQWFPSQSGLATAVYSNGLLMGEIVAVSLTVAVILPLVGQSWQLTLFIWSIPVIITAVTIALWTPHVSREPHDEPILWWPDWRDRQTWSLGLILGCASIAYFGANAFIPDYLKATHHGAYISAALTSLNVGQLPASLLVAAAPQYLVGRRWPVAATGFIMFFAAIGLYASGPWVIADASVLGFCAAMIFVLSLALPPVLAGEHEVHRLSAAMFAIAYTCSFGASFLGGALWDATGIAKTTYAPIVLAGPLMIALVSRLQLSVTSADHPEQGSG